MVSSLNLRSNGRLSIRWQQQLQHAILELKSSTGFILYYSRVHWVYSFSLWYAVILVVDCGLVYIWLILSICVHMIALRKNNCIFMMTLGLLVPHSNGVNQEYPSYKEILVFVICILYFFGEQIVTRRESIYTSHTLWLRYSDIWSCINTCSWKGVGRVQCD